MAQEKKDESFRVVDRRLFTPAGDLRQEVVEEQRREEKQAEKAAEKRSAGAKVSGTTTTAATPAPKNEPAAAIGLQAADDGTEPAASRSFEMLVDLLARNAAALLGAIADPQTGKAYVDLEGARDMIDMLDVLREKTRGNLAREDEQLLLDVVGSLKLSFMEVSKAATEAMRKNAKGKS